MQLPKWLKLWLVLGLTLLAFNAVFAQAPATNILDQLKADWKPGTVNRSSAGLLATSQFLTAPNAWYLDVIPGVNLATLSGFYFQYVGWPLAILLLCLHVASGSMSGRFDAFDLFKRFFVATGMLVGAGPIFQTMNTVQQGFPKLMQTLIAAANSDTLNQYYYTEDIAVVARIKRSVETVEGMVVANLVTRASVLAPAQSYTGNVATKQTDGTIVTKPGPINLLARPYVDYMIVTLQNAVNGIPNATNKPGMPSIATTNPDGSVVSWYDGALSRKLSDYTTRVTYLLRYHPTMGQLMSDKITTTFYPNNTGVFQTSTTVAGPGATATIVKGIDDTLFSQFESDLYDIYMGFLGGLANTDLAQGIVITNVTGASAGTPRGTSTVGGYKPDSSALRVGSAITSAANYFTGSVFAAAADDSLAVYVSRDTSITIATLGKAPAVQEEESTLHKMIRIACEAVGAVISQFVLSLFTWGFNLMLRVQFFFTMLAIPFYFSEKTEKAFINSFLTCITLVLIPLVGLMLLTIWNLTFSALTASMLAP